MGGGSIFWKTREIGLPTYNDLSTVSAQGLPPVPLTPVTNGKNLQSENLSPLSLTPVAYLPPVQQHRQNW
jgi:hypothetical protein